MSQAGWDDYGYYVQTGPFGQGGMAIETPDPCSALSALEGQAGVVEQQRGLIDQVSADCAAIREAVPGPPPATVAPGPAASSSPPVESGPHQEDSAQRQGAPEVAVTATVAVRPGAGNAHSSSRPRSPFDQWAPMSPDDLARMLAPPGSSEADTRALSERIARNMPAPGKKDPTFATPSARAPAVAGDPVDLFSGTLSLSAVDLVVPTADLPIRFERSYRSGRPYFGPFGFGWDHCYNVYLRPLDDGGMALWSGRLQERVFTPAGGGWEPERGLAARLERIPGLPDTFDVVHPGGLRWRFGRPADWGNAETVPLSAITDRHGSSIRLGYDTRGRVATVLDPAGRGLQLGYGECGLLERVGDHTGTRLVRYLHHAEVEHLARVVLPATAGHPDGIATGYEYDLRADHSAMRHNILRITDAGSRTYLENEYAGPEVGWAFNSVVRQLAGGHEYRLEYEQVQYVPRDEQYLDVPATRASVSYPDGALRVHTFNYRGDLLDLRQRLNRDGTYRVLTSRYGYDREGNCTEAVTPDGIRHLRRHDALHADPCARRNLLRAEMATSLPGLAPSRVLQVNQYEPRYQLLTSSTDETGATTRLVYDLDGPSAGATGRLLRIELPPVTLPDGTAQDSTTHFEHDSLGRLTAHRSPGGARTVYEYGPTGPHAGMLVRTVQDPGGAALVTSFGYDAVGHPRRVTVPGGRVTEVRCNALGQAEEITPPPVPGAGAPIRTWYGDDGSPVRRQRPRGMVTEPATTDDFHADVLDRDVLGRVVAVHQAANTERPRVWRRRLDHDGHPVQETDPTGAVLTRRYDERGLVVREVRAPGTPDETRTEYAYDRGGRLSRMTDPSGRRTTVEYDVWGRVRAVTLPTGAGRLYSWGPGDRLLDVTEEGSPGPGEPSRPLTRSSFGYDERGRMTSTASWAFVDDPATAVLLTTRYGYDHEDRVASIELPLGRVLRFTTDVLGRPTSSSDGLGTTHSTHYDGAGDPDLVTVATTAGGSTRQVSWAYDYDGRGRLRAVDAPTGRTEIDLDDAGRPVERREPGAVTTRFTWNAFEQIEQTLLDPGAMDVRSHWEYDDAGSLCRYTDPEGARTSWDHDPLGRVRRTTLPDGSQWRTDIDLATSVVEHSTPGGSRITHLFGEEGRVTRREVAAGPGVDPVPAQEYVYDALGRLLRAIQPTGSVERRYDSLHRLLEETTTHGSVRARYDDAAATSDLAYPDGRIERTGYDFAGRPTDVHLVTAGVLGGTAGAVLAQVQYSSRPVAVTLPNGVVTELQYDDLQRPVAIRHVRGGTLIEGWQARYDARGRRALVQVLGAPASGALHRFDARDRLREVRWGFGAVPLGAALTAGDHAAVLAAALPAAAAATDSESYLLDGADGRRRRTRTRTGSAPTVEDYLLGPDHRILTAAGKPIGYHDDGHRADDDRLRFDVDALGRVVRIRDAATGVVRVRFDYDALSRVVTGSDATGPFARSFWHGHWVQERRGPAGEVRQSCPHPLWQQPLALLDGGGLRFLHPDGGQSTLCVTDAAGTVRERHRYGPFGDAALLGADGVTPLLTGATGARWRGMPLEESVGLFTTPARLYDPAAGVFLAPDPLLYLDSPSSTTFAQHNPVDFNDATGLGKNPLGHGEQPMPAGTPEHIAAAAPDWTTQTEWAYPRPDSRLIQPVTSVDTGNRAVNVVVNKVLLPWRNALAFAENVPLAVLLGTDDALRRSPVAAEYDAAQHMLPLAPAMGLALEGVPAALSALQVYGRALGDVLVWGARAPASLALGVIGGGVPPLRSAAARAAFGWDAGLIDVGQGRLGFTSYSTASSVRRAVGMAGQSMEDMHMLPQTIGNALPSSYGYSPHRALTTSAPKALHQAWDRTWTPVWNAAVKNKTPMTADDVYRMLVSALENPLPDPATGQVLRFAPEVRGTIVFAIEAEMKALGLQGTTPILP